MPGVYLDDICPGSRRIIWGDQSGRPSPCPVCGRILTPILIAHQTYNVRRYRYGVPNHTPATATTASKEAA